MRGKPEAGRNFGTHPIHRVRGEPDARMRSRLHALRAIVLLLALSSPFATGMADHGAGTDADGIDGDDIDGTGVELCAALHTAIEWGPPNYGEDPRHDSKRTVRYVDRAAVAEV